MLTQEQYLVLQQRTRRLEIKIELLNNNDVVIDSFEGYAASGSINMQSDSAYRRSGSLKMIVNNNELLPKPNSKIWFNRKIRIHVGLKDWSDETIWFNQGIYVMQDVSIDDSTNGISIDITLSDLISLIDGKMDGILTHEVKVIPEGHKVSDEIRQALAHLGKVSVDDIIVNDASVTAPYTISMQPSSTVYELVKTLTDLFYGMEIFYDENGFLIIQKIKDRKFDPLLWDFSAEGMNLTINSSNIVDFANVRNAIYLWGRKKNTGETVKWVYRNRFSRESVMAMNNIADKTKGDICHVISDNISYVWDENWKELDFTVSPEFNIESIGEKKFSSTDEKIATIEQAMLRAEFELKKRNHMAESVSFSCLPLYGLSPNDKVYIKNEKNGIDGDYTVKSIGFGLSYGDLMQVNADKIYY